MIEIKAAEEYRQCQCCYSKGNIKEIEFSSERHGVVIAICNDCISELIRKLDAVKVVRCKDCKHSEVYCGDTWCNYLLGSFGEKGDLRVDANWFCGEGERK